MMAQQLYLFTGEDSYRLDRELARWMKGFEDKHGQGSVLSFRGEWEVGDVLSQLQGGGLFSQQKMIVLSGVPMDNGAGQKRSVADIDPVFEQIKRLTTQWPGDLWAICISHKPDKRTSGFKWFKNTVDIKDFSVLTPAKLRSYLRKEFPDVLTADQYDQLIERVGTDTRRVLSEVDKVQRWMKANNLETVTDEQLRLVASGEADADTFAFVHLIFKDDVTRAMKLVDNVRDGGTHWSMFWGSATWGLRLLVPMIEGVKQGLDSKALAKELKAPPFGVAKLMKLAQSELDRDGGVRVRGFFRAMLAIEYDVKSGKLPEEAVWGQLKRAISAKL